MADQKVSVLLQLKDEFSKQMKKATSSYTNNAKKISSIGKEMTRKITLPLVALGGLSVKAASDFEVVSNKFNTAFSGVGDQAKYMAKELSNSFDISKSKSEELLSNTGDLLKGFGSTSKQALDTSMKVQKLSIALGAYNKVSPKAASEAVTKALFGETESLKTLGVVIRQTDIQQRLALKGQKDLTGQALLQAKAQAALELATEQSRDAIKSYGENSDTAQRKLQRTKAKIEDLAVTIGDKLLPIFEKLIDGVSKALTWFTSLDNGTQTFILTLAGVIAVAGPLASSITAITTVLGGLGTALAFIAANPIVLIVGALIAVGVAIWKARDDFVEAGKIIAQSWIDLWEKVKNTVIEKWNAIIDFLEGVWTTITDSVTTVWEAIVTFFTDTFNTIYNYIFNVLNNITTFWINIWNGIKKIVVVIWGAIKTAVSNGINTVAAFLIGAKTIITDAFSTAWSAVVGVTEGIMDGIKGAFKSMVNFVIKMINKLISAANSVSGGLSKIPGVSIGKISSIPLLAKGGVVNKPTLAMIGEDGPEAVVPLNKKNNPMYGQGGGITINITGTFLSEDVAEQLGDQIVNKLALSTQF